jgi:hypothetical protein
MLSGTILRKNKMQVILCNNCIASPVCVNTLKNGSGIIYKGDSCMLVQKLVEKKITSINNARDEILRLLKVARSDYKQHNWKKLFLVFKRIAHYVEVS